MGVRRVHGRRPPPARDGGKGTCALCGASERGDCFCEIADGAEDSASAAVVPGARLPASRGVATDGRRACSAWTLEGGPHEVRGSKELGAVSSPRSRLKAFVGRLDGASDRRLQRRLDWFCWRERFRSSARDHRDLLFGHEAAGRYACTRRLTHLDSRPFMSCVNRWTIGERHGYASMVV